MRNCLKSVLLQLLQYLDMEKFRWNDAELYQFTVPISRVNRLGSCNKIGPYMMPSGGSATNSAS